MEAWADIDTMWKLEVNENWILRWAIAASVASIFLLAGTHGDEKWWLKWLEIARKWGMQTCIVNPEAVCMWVRYVDQDINRVTSEWYEHDRFWELQRRLAQSTDNPYFVDLHNCNWTAKLWIIFSGLETHKQVAVELWLDALLVFESEIWEWTIIEKLNSNIWWMGMIIEVWIGIDTHWETSEDIAKRLADINQRIKSWENLIWWLWMKSSIPVLKISILRDASWDPIINSNAIPANSLIPDYCILGRWWQFWIVKNEDGTYPEEDLIKSTIEML